MDRWKSRGGKSQREKRRAEERRSEKRKSEKKEDAGARKGRKVAKHCVFQMICGSGGSKSRLAKAAGAEPPGQMRDEKVHVVVARSTISKSKRTKHLSFGALLKVEMIWDVEKVHAVMARSKHISKSKRTKHTNVGATFGSWDVEKVHAVVVRSTFPSQNVQSTPAPDHFWKLRCRQSAVYVVVVRSTFRNSKGFKRHNMLEPLLKVQMWFCVAGARNLCALPNVSKTWGFCSISKSDGRHGTFAEDLQRCISRGRRCASETWRRWFPERGWILEFQIFSLHDRCNTSYDLASLFPGGRNSFRQMECKNCKAHWYEAVSSALNFPFFWRKSRRIASFLTLSGSKVEEVSQNCFVFKLANRQIG